MFIFAINFKTKPSFEKPKSKTLKQVGTNIYWQRQKYK